MKVSWHIGLLIAVASLASGTDASAQAQPGTAAPSARGTSQPLVVRRPDTHAFNRVSTTARDASTGTPRAYSGSARDSASGTSRLAYGGASPSAVAAVAQNDPLRPYSPRAREAERQAAMRTTRPMTTQQVAAAPRTVQPRNYYPNMRISQHPNANTPQTRAHCTPGRGSVMAGGMGIGMGMGTRRGR